MDPSFINTATNTGSVKLVVCEEPIDSAAVPPVLAKSDVEPELGNATSSELFSCIQSELPESELKPNQKKTADELMKVVTDPNAPEGVWLNAWNELKEREPAPEADLRGGARRPSMHMQDILKMTCIASSFIMSICALVVITDFTSSHHGPASTVAVSASKQNESASESKSAEKEINFGPYMAELDKKIKAKWHPPDNYGRIIATFRIHKDGHLSNLGLKQMMHYTPSDLAALKAIVEASDFPPLPEGSPEWVDTSFTFDYTDADLQNSKSQDTKKK